MIETNQLIEAVNGAKAVHDQLTANWPAICAGAVIVARELKNINAWLADLGAAVIRHGGLFMLAKKLIWNREVQP